MCLAGRLGRRLWMCAGLHTVVLGRSCHVLLGQLLCETALLGCERSFLSIWPAGAQPAAEPGLAGAVPGWRGPRPPASRSGGEKEVICGSNILLISAAWLGRSSPHASTWVAGGSRS